MKKTLLSTALLLSSLAVPAIANTDCGWDPNLSGSVGVGYTNNYSHQNLVLNNEYMERGATAVGTSLKYSIPNTVDFIACFSHTNLDSAYIEDATSLFVGIQGEKIKGLTTTLGYALEDGGIPGLAVAERKWAKNNGAVYDGDRDTDHLIRFGLKYQSQDCGLFMTGGIAYSVSGSEGLLMDVGLGYKWDPSDRLAVILAGNVSFSQGYLNTLNNEGYGQRLNGIDGYSVSLAFPLKASKAVTITPYVAGTWAGHNAIAYSKAWEQKIFRNFAPIAGVCVNWDF